MTQAITIQATARNANDATEAAEKIATGVDQDWNAEATIYTLPDDSVIVIAGPCVNAYEDIEAAMEALTL